MPSYPNRYSSYGGGGGGFPLALPPFRGAVRSLVLLNIAVYFVVRIGDIAYPPPQGFAWQMNQIFGFIPDAITHHFRIWQFVTYSFLHVGVMHLLGNMLMLWMFGSTVEGGWGRKRFLQYYFFCVITAALTTVGVGYLGQVAVTAHWASPLWISLADLLVSPTVGASGGVYGILIAFGVLYGDQDVILFPIPFRIKAKYLVAGLAIVVLASALQPSKSGVADYAHLGGLLFGWLYLKFGPRGALTFNLSEQYFGLRNAWYRWKRRRAGRKFEVYMRQHDRSEYFDEHGNFREPKEDKHKGNGEHRGPWVQ